MGTNGKGDRRHWVVDLIVFVGLIVVAGFAASMAISHCLTAVIDFMGK